MTGAMRADAVRNRDRLMVAAAELFADRGVDVPLEEIARRAGVSIGTLYNHFPNRAALFDAVLPGRLVELDRLAQAALSHSDPWHGFTGFLEGLFAIQARDRSMNEAIWRSAGRPVEVEAECGRAGATLGSVVDHAKNAGVLRSDFDAEDLATLVWAMSTVISKSNGDDDVWRRHLGFVLDGLRAK